MGWIEDYNAIKEDVHMGFILEAMDAIMFVRSRGEVPEEEEWRYLELMGACCHAMGDTVGALTAYFDAAKKDKILRSQREHFSNYLYLCQAVAGLSPAIIKEQFDIYAGLYGEDETLPKRKRTSHKRIRVGFIAPHFVASSTSLFYEKILTGLDSERFEIYAYSLSKDVDDFTTELQKHDIYYTVLAGKSIEEQAFAIRDDRIDILIDLGGHTEGGMTLMIMAKRPAPVSISALGWFATTGLKAIDYTLGDDMLIPKAAEEFYSEEILRLPNAYLFSPNALMLQAPVPKRGKDEPITFGSLQNVMKISDKTLSLWRKILKEVKGSRLVIQDTLEQPLRVTATLRRLEEAHLPLKRVFVRPGKKEYLTSYGDIDIQLDTFPYTGAASTATALYMGVPVITLAGETEASRLSASILRAVGHEEWITYNDDSYVALAKTMASEVGKLRESRSDLRIDVMRSALTDSEKHLRSFEAMLLEAWQAKGDFKFEK